MRKLKVGSLFSGIGGLELGLEQTGHFETAWQVECEPYALKVLERHWPDVPRFTDVRDFPPDSSEDYAVDLVCGGFPCQNVSNSNTPTGGVKGLEGAKSGLWFEFDRIVRVLRPKWALVENVGALNVRGLSAVLWGFASKGYAAEWATISAGSVGAPHLRKRVFILAVQDPDGTGLEGHVGQILAQPDDWRQDANAAGSTWWAAEPAVDRVVNGVSRRVDASGKRVKPYIKERLERLGNAVVPAVAKWIGERIVSVEKATK